MLLFGFAECPFVVMLVVPFDTTLPGFFVDLHFHERVPNQNGCGSKSRTLVNISILTKTGSIMGAEFTYPKMGSKTVLTTAAKYLPRPPGLLGGLPLPGGVGCLGCLGRHELSAGAAAGHGAHVAGLLPVPGGQARHRGKNVGGWMGFRGVTGVFLPPVRRLVTPPKKGILHYGSNKFPQEVANRPPVQGFSGYSVGSLGFKLFSNRGLLIGPTDG